MFFSPLLLLVLGVLATIYLLRLYKKRKEYVELMDKIPGPPSVPLVGNILNFLVPSDQLFKVYQEISVQYRPIVRIWSGTIPSVIILSPHDVERFIGGIKNMEKSKIYEILHPWLGTGLLTSTGSKWFNRRKILTPAFHFNILQQFVPVFTNQTEILVEELRKECQKPFTDIVPLITQFTLHSICETAMGTSFKASEKSKDAYKQAIFKMGEITIHRMLRPWLYQTMTFFFSSKFWEQQKVIGFLRNFSQKVIDERKSLMKEMPEEKTNEDEFSRKKLAMLDLLISAGPKAIDDEGIREEVDTFMFEGHDTTTVSICFTLMLLASHKEIQEKVVEEIEEVLGDIKIPTYSDLQKLRYLEMCIKESLRLYPSVHFISRLSDEDVVTHSGYKIPKGTYFHINIYDIHHNPEIYPDPEKFDPDRFLPENCKDRHPFAYIPFSAGPRNCIGQKFAILEMKAVIAGIVRNFMLEPIDTQSSITLVADLVLRTKDGIKVKFSPRA